MMFGRIVTWSWVRRLTADWLRAELCRSGILSAVLMLGIQIMPAEAQVARRPQAGRGAPPQFPFGSIEVLQEKLFRDSDSEKLLERLEAYGLTTETFESLQQLFATSADLYTLHDGQPRSLREAALALLKKAPESTRAAWEQSLSLVAERDFEKACESGSAADLVRVATAFPLTDVSIRSRLLACVLLRDSGESFEAQRQLSTLTYEFAGTALQTRVNRHVAELTSQLAVPQDPESAVIQMSTMPQTGKAGPPWPQPLWQWHETLWLQSGIPGMLTGDFLEQYSERQLQDRQEFQNFPTAFWGSEVIVRSPLRVVGLDASTGREKWSLPTDTVDSALRRQYQARTSDFDSGIPRIDYAEQRLSRMPRLGTLASDDDYLWFLDRFDLLTSNERQQSMMFQAGPFNPRMDDAADPSDDFDATRLVALRRSGPDQIPHIAWIVGGRSNFNYEIAADIRQHPLARPVDQNGDQSSESETPTHEAEDIVSPGAKPTPFDGHRFLSLPAGHNERLYFLSATRDRIVLNCLRKTTGQVLWQQPVTWHDPNAWGRLEFWNAADGANACLVADDVVICWMADGMLAGVRSSDGTLLWATALRNTLSVDQGSPFAPGPSMEDDEPAIESPAVYTPVIAGNLVICQFCQSRFLRAVDVKTGQIVWEASRRAFGAGEIGGSLDHYIAGTTSDRVFLVGERHFRCLDLANGNQKWVTEIPTTTGRAVCSDLFCVLPLQGQTTALLRLSDGQLMEDSTAFLPERSVGVFGALSAQSTLLTAATPTSVVAFPRADLMYTESSATESPAEGNPNTSIRKDLVQQSQAMLLCGERDKAIQLLKQTMENRDTEPPRKQAAARFLAELILTEWGGHLETAGTADGSHSHDGAELALLQQIDEIPNAMTSEQQIRSAVLAVLASGHSTIPDAAIADLREFREWKKPVRMTGSWTIRPELLLNRAVAIREMTSDAVASASLRQLKRWTEEAVLFPDQYPSMDIRKQLLARLLQLREYGCAELLVASRLSKLPSEGLQERAEALEELRQIRAIRIVDGTLQSTAEANSAQATSSNVNKGFVSESAFQVKSNVTQQIHSQDWEASLLDLATSVRGMPSWMPHAALLVDGVSGVEFATWDPADSTFHDRVPLPSPASRASLAFRQLENEVTTPGLVPIAGESELMMAHCTVAGRTKFLWSRKYRQGESEDKVIEFGPLGPDHMIWQFANTLHCSHPLTGEDLWTRRLPLSESQDYIAGVRRIFGDQNIVIVLGSDLQSWRSYRTRDGRFVSSGRLDIGRATDTRTIGRCLLYTDSSSQLHLFDGLSGEDLLADDPPILPARHISDSRFHVLSEGRVVTISATHEILMIDTHSGEVLFTSPVVEPITSGVVFDFVAFERNGRLFVGIQDHQPDWTSNFVTPLRADEPHLRDGLLLCLDATTGKPQWSTRLTNAVFAPVAGNPTDVLVTWGMEQRKMETGEELNGYLLKVTILNGSTGLPIASETAVSSTRPVTCVHSAASKSIELSTNDAKLTFVIEQPESNQQKSNPPETAPSR